MSYTESDLEKLESAIAEGARRVRYSDKEVEYRSLNEMLTIRDQMREELGKKDKPSRRVGEFHKGLK